jgi:hypothetical protein
MEPGKSFVLAGSSQDGVDDEQSLTMLHEIWLFLRATGKWWLVPVIFALLLLGAAMILSASSYAPFLYTLF